MGLIAGVDEAGRGPLAGSVVAAAVILDPANPIAGLRDSKKLTARQREKLFDVICDRALAWGIASATAKEIDAINILQATFLAMQRAVRKLKLMPEQILVDGNMCPKFPVAAQAIIQGDSKVECISAASILAKVTRDQQMVDLDRQYSNYGFAKHKGYPTTEHIAALQLYGPCVEHRVSYKPVRIAMHQGILIPDNIE